MSYLDICLSVYKKVSLHKQLSDDFPTSALNWIKKYEWDDPHPVPLKDVDFSNQKSWNAKPNKVQKFKKKILSGFKKPVVLVRVPGSPKYMVVDGHHRALAYLLLKKPVIAWTADVDRVEGPWQTLHDHAKNH